MLEAITAPPESPNPLKLPPGVKQPTGEFGASNFFPAKGPNGEAIPPATPAPEVKPTPPPAEPAPTGLTDRIAEAANLRKVEAAKPPEAPPAKPAGEAAPTEVEALDFEKVEMDGRVSAKSTEAFKLVKAQAKQHVIKLGGEVAAAQKRITALEEQLKTAPVGTMTNAEVETLKKEHKALSENLLLVKLETHPDFQRQFVQPREQAQTTAAEILSSQKVEGVDIAKLLTLPRAEFAKQVSEVAAKLPSFDATEFSAQMRQAYQLKQGESAALAKSHETYDALQKNRLESGVAAFNRAMSKVGGDITKLIPRVEPPKGATAEQIEKITKYNLDREKIQTVARQRVLESTSPDEVAMSGIKSAAYDFHVEQVLPAIIGEYQNLQRAYAELAAEYKAMKGKNPNNMGFTPPIPPPDVLKKEMENVPKDEQIGVLSKRFFPRPGNAR